MSENSVVIETIGLTKYFGKFKAIDNLNFTVKKGEIFGYLGPNGAGKTTTIRSILNFIQPSKGEARVFGMDSSKFSMQILKKIGYLPGELHLYNNLSGKDLLKYLGNLHRKYNKALVEDLASRLNVDLNKKIKALSHGDKQKLGIINAFMGEADLLILDEPTSGLDPLVQSDFNQMLLEAKKKGKTIFISSHILPEVERICDRVAIIREGKLIVTEEIETLKTKAIRPLSVTFEVAPKAEDFKSATGVKDVKSDGKVLHCSVVGTLDSFIKDIAKYKVVNIVTEEPNLEEIFMSYYRGENSVK